MRFETEEEDMLSLDNVEESPMIVIDEDQVEPPKKDAEVVSLDSFRKS